MDWSEMMRIEKADIYISEDGKRFATEAECAAHESAENAKAKRLEKLRVYGVSHSFDSTEGRGYYRHTSIITDQPLPHVIQWCFDQFGQPLAQWYGSGHYEAWRMSEKPEHGAEAVKRALGRQGKDSFGCVRGVVFLSNSALDGLPVPVSAWPRKKVQP